VILSREMGRGYYDRAGCRSSPVPIGCALASSAELVNAAGFLPLRGVIAFALVEFGIRYLAPFCEKTPGQWGRAAVEKS
jgi:hypothetical protein